MAHQYAKLAFTEAVKNVQVEQRSRDNYQSMDSGPDYNGQLSQVEAQFIEARDSFYMASVSETNWPYVQHRGGPVGFLKVIDSTTIGFADFTGNRQYVSTGNFRNNKRVSLILMDYVNQRRLKILGTVKEVSKENQQVLSKLDNKGYRARVERGFIINVDAFDWNCPKYITQRYSEEEVQALLEKSRNELLATIALDEKANNLNSSGAKSQLLSQPINSGNLKLTLSGIRQLTSKVRAFEFRGTNGEVLPKIAAGAHIQVPVILAGGNIASRYYSICSNPARRDIYEIAVLLDEKGNGGSLSMHHDYQLGQEIIISQPNNYFKLNDGKSGKKILIAGGIGITAIKPMAQQLKKQNRPFEIHYVGSEYKQMAFVDRLAKEFKDELHIYQSKHNNRLHLPTLLNKSSELDCFYICGPQRLHQEFHHLAAMFNINKNNIFEEKFVTSKQSLPNNDVSIQNQAFEVELTKSNKKFTVDSEESVLDALLEQDIEINYACKTGVCKSCVVEVTSGEIEHNDNVLTDEEKVSLFCPCVSRAKSKSITLNL